jgi:hypothetical protein
MLSNTMPENAAHAAADPEQTAVASDLSPRSACRNSAVMDQGAFSPISAPAPATHPVVEKLLSPVNETLGLAAPAGVKLSALLCEPRAVRCPGATGVARYITHVHTQVRAVPRSLALRKRNAWHAQQDKQNHGVGQENHSFLAMPSTASLRCR